VDKIVNEIDRNFTGKYIHIISSGSPCLPPPNVGIIFPTSILNVIQKHCLRGRGRGILGTHARYRNQTTI
jgi:hypothetical protein